MNEPEEVKKMYNRTHGLSDPGEQKNRGYNWTVDKHNFVFGKPDNIETDGAKKSLRTDLLEANYPKTRIVDKRLEDYRQATSDVVGCGKFRGMMKCDLDPSHTFGKKSIIGDNWNVAKCLSGDPEEKNDKHYEPDPDLGKSVLHRTKLQSLKPKENEQGRTYGVPSVRIDLQKKQFMSVTNNTVYYFNIELWG